MSGACHHWRLPLVLGVLAAGAYALWRRRSTTLSPLPGTVATQGAMTPAATGTGSTGSGSTGTAAAGTGSIRPVASGEGMRSPVSSARRLARTAELGVLAGRLGATAASYKARRIVASPERREALDMELAMKTAEQVSEALGGMKGALMKLGQLASFLDDGLPENVRQAFEQLQQDAPPMAPHLAAGVVEEELGVSPEKCFAYWEPIPFAAASIGQVHRARLDDGREVAVKVQYPGVDEAVASDLANMDLARMGLPFLFPGLDSAEVAEELRLRLVEELDYTSEAANQREFARWYEGHPFISVPHVVDEMSTRRVLTTELASGSRFSAMECWDQDERDLAAEAIYRFVFRSLYRFHTFNGDPHPGNYLFETGGRVTFLDFGLVKRFDDDQVAMLYEVVKSSISTDDPGVLRSACERAGLFLPGAAVSDQRIAEFMGVFWELVREDRPTTITAAWASEVAHRYVGRSTFGDVLQHASMPAWLVVLQRINLGLLAILGRLEATANWRRISEEFWPTNGPPSTPLGELEAEWWASRSHPRTVSG